MNTLQRIGSIVNALAWAFAGALVLAIWLASSGATLRGQTPPALHADLDALAGTTFDEWWERGERKIDYARFPDKWAAARRLSAATWTAGHFIGMVDEHRECGHQPNERKDAL